MYFSLPPLGPSHLLPLVQVAKEKRWLFGDKRAEFVCLRQEKKSSLKRICHWLWIRCLEGVPLLWENAQCVSMFYLFCGARATVTVCVCVCVPVQSLVRDTSAGASLLHHRYMVLQAPRLLLFFIIFPVSLAFSCFIMFLIFVPDMFRTLSYLRVSVWKLEPSISTVLIRLKEYLSVKMKVLSVIPLIPPLGHTFWESLSSLFLCSCCFFCISSPLNTYTGLNLQARWCWLVIFPFPCSCRLYVPQQSLPVNMHFSYCVITLDLQTFIHHFPGLCLWAAASF